MTGRLTISLRVPIEGVDYLYRFWYVRTVLAFVVHIRLVLCGIVIFSWWGLPGSVILIVGHGLCSSGLLCLANIAYERTGRRRLIVNKGLLAFIPRIGLWWFLLRARNMARPPSLNVAPEIILILTVLSWRKISIVGLRLLFFFSSASYTLYIYRLRQHGVFITLYSCCSGKVREYLKLFLYWFPLNVIIINRALLIT